MRSPRRKVKALIATETASSPQVLRALNARTVLEHAWESDAFTASDVMASVGLTRATVIGVCDELVGKGWLDEIDDAPGTGRKGRPARRYAFRERAGVVIGIDAGFDRMSARVADLRGVDLGTAQIRIPARSPESRDRLADAEERRRLARDVYERAIEDAGVTSADVLALTLGVPAPVNDQGQSPESANSFWAVMNPGFRDDFAGDGRIVTVENDANLAAIAERASARGRGRDVSSYISLLVGEGIGPGLMIDGRLVRGRRGGAGEMRFLDYVDGVRSANGLAMVARQWALEAIATGEIGEGGALARIAVGTLTESDVARAAQAGDAVAREILDRLAARLARICIVLGDLLDVDRVIVGGALVESLPAVIDGAAREIAESGDPTAPELVASRLGVDAVSTGAVEHALSLVRERALELQPGTRSAHLVTSPA